MQFFHVRVTSCLCTGKVSTIRATMHRDAACGTMHCVHLWICQMFLDCFEDTSPAAQNRERGETES
jgi:hypothetical protein